MSAPATHLRWNLYGAGLENLGRDGKPERLPTPQPAPNEILVRIDAVGICFSDLKILRLGEAHPKIDRDLRKHPAVMGHEICCTVVQVGDALQGRFRVGERYIVQADVYVNGRVQAVGYALDGGYTQYTVFGEPVLNGDAGCYLLRSPQMHSLLETLKKVADFIIIDTPSAATFADGTVIGLAAGNVLIVHAAGNGMTDATREMLARLRQHNANLVGVVLNKVRLDDSVVYRHFQKGYTRALESRNGAATRAALPAASTRVDDSEPEQTTPRD